MSDLWWLQPGWTAARCAQCGEKIWPEGDPDWGVCSRCFQDAQPPAAKFQYVCDVCHRGEAVTGVNGLGVCSEACADEAAKQTSHATPPERVG